MHNNNCFSEQSAALISLLLLSAIFTAMISNVSADSTTLYLDWELTDDKDTYGHLTLSGFPETMEYEKTYKVEITLTLESDKPINLGLLEFNMSTGSTELYLGNCATNSTLNRAESFTLYSNWKIERNENQSLNQGNLTIHSNNQIENKTLTTKPKDITIKIKESSILKLTSADVKTIPYPLNLIEEVSVSGNLWNSSSERIENITWSKVSLTYLSPNGTEIIRQVSTDDSGAFADKFYPELAGTWRVIATWNGTEKYSAATSIVKVFNVEGSNPLILIIIAVAVFVFLVAFSPLYYRKKPKKESIYGSRDRPSAPLNVQAIAGNNQVVLSWIAPSADEETPITSYTIYKGAESEKHNKLIDTSSSSTTYTDSEVVKEQTYYYSISATNAVGESPKSNEASTTPWESTKTMSVAVHLDGETYQSNQLLVISITANDKNSKEPILEAIATTAIYSPSGKTLEISNEQSKQDGVAKINYKLANNAQKGTYKIKTTLSKNGYLPGTAETIFKVS